ncbi:acyl-CoA dehydrogenase family protein [Nocardia sp. NPDC057272]|uniref:acyl-CoA dehydrogenase family protein n=1 Tax=Nocardia sp. NPDC057272 TaxID=3346079 RepID=UPI003637F0C0
MTRVLTTEPELSQFAGSVRAMIAAHSPVDATRAGAGAPMDPAWWQTWAAEMDLPGLLVGEADGGAGAELDAAAIAATELGAGLVPGPLTSTMLAGLALSRAGASKAAGRIAAGTAPAALVLADAHDLTAGEQVSGTIPTLDHAADLAVVVAVLGNRLAVLETSTATVTPVEHPLDETRRAGRMTFAGADAKFFDITAELATELVVAATVLAAAEQFGLMRHALAESVEYLNARTAFGRVVGSFQGLKHQLAELACEVAQADALLADAVAAATNRDADAELAAVAAWCRIAAAGTHVVSECLRLHGGIGYTWEHDAHLWFRRARHNQSARGRLVVQRQRLAELLGLG